MRDGGFPYIAVLDRTPEKVETYLEGIYNTVIVKDIEDQQIRKETNPDKRKITDILLLKTIAKYLASVVGNPVSIRSITDYLTSNGRKVSPNTVGDYVAALTESFIFYPAERFDIVAEKQGAYTYFQVTADMTVKETFHRKLKPLSNIRDNYEKIVLTGDKLTVGNYNGIQVKNLSDWLLGK